MSPAEMEATRREVEIREAVQNIAPHEPEIADVLTYLLAENRRMRRIIAGMEERIETSGVVSEAYREYAQSGAFDPRD